MSLRLTIRIGLAVLGISWLCLVMPAAAQDEKARARQLFNQGVTQFEAGEHRQIAVKVIDDRGNELLVKPLDRA